MTRRVDPAATGSTTVEITMFVPLLLLILLLIVGMGRLASARATVDGAARDAARAASIRRDATSALEAARVAATATLADRGILCQSLGVAFDASHTDFTAGGAVAVRVDCTVRLDETVLTGLPGSKTVSGNFVAPIDVYRGGS
jgi:Flp pilus assembly protein TadG